MGKKRPILSDREFFEKGHLYYLPHLSIDNVIFGFHDNELKVLLLQWKENNRWCLPGGFILKDEHVEDAAIRVLHSRTGLSKIYLNQFYAFGDPHRERTKHGITTPKWAKSKSWFNDRFITIGYWALVEFSKVIPTPDLFSARCVWWEIDKVPNMILDHNQILEKALESLRRNLNDYPVGKDLLPQKFTMPELQRLYETILDKKLDRRNFQKKILGLGILDRLEERKIGGAHKAPYLYKFDQRKYERAMKQGLKFGLQ
ncbi:MAG TPA: NUDIX domain-containing protein [Chryseolinea sp.]|nr:NUDIX domain-containing protein [Chryseolinea sp.]